MKKVIAENREMRVASSDRRPVKRFDKQKNDINKDRHELWQCEDRSFE